MTRKDKLLIVKVSLSDLISPAEVYPKWKFMTYLVHQNLHVARKIWNVSNTTPRWFRYYRDPVITPILLLVTSDSGYWKLVEAVWTNYCVKTPSTPSWSKWEHESVTWGMNPLQYVIAIERTFLPNEIWISMHLLI